MYAKSSSFLAITSQLRLLCRVTSQYRGVRWHYCNSKWEARIFDGTRQVSLGYSDSELEAAKMYDQEAIRLRGYTAVVNFRPQAQRDSASRKQMRENLSDKPEEMREGALLSESR